MRNNPTAPDLSNGFEPQTRNGLTVEWLFTLVALLLAFIVMTHGLAYLEGTGRVHGGRWLEMWFLISSGFLALCVLGGITVRLNGSWRLLARHTRKRMFILLGVNAILPVTCFLIGEPSKHAFLQGFAKRAGRIVVIDDGIRQWLRERVKADPNFSGDLSHCPEAIQKTFARLTIDKSSVYEWRVNLVGDSIAEFTTGGGMERPWGLAICYAGEIPATANRYHCLIPIDKQLFVFDL